ncbi:hypothetical protein [cf. Phormidesmis sp. LEGE 11477]|uniref:hypothetical protein n=1 Tax=cf. Phormidesmis sp. LEGE 11477 TaxID=1828680 RepID=UPI00188283EC|nr:hypothetical protein [cf. Phormidesmis sp. LEGE 11477]MBE9064503.1 hypothetical protein [cf. Phormidesmis sp. LEGE 11477]
MRSKTLLSTIGLLWALGACTGSPGSSVGSSTAPNSQLGDRIADTTSDPAKTCDLDSAPLEPMATPENMPIFEQFNFRPEEIAIEPGTVTFKTPYYDFTLCKGDRTWSITSVTDKSSDLEADFDYGQMLAGIANPDYSAIDMNGKTYEYRIRLQADWLNEQLATYGEPPFNPEMGSAESAEDAVYFELKLPNGELLTEQLYTLTDLQEAELGFSLGDPTIAGAVVVEDQLWFATSANQGEGNSGFASLIHYDPTTQKIAVQQPEQMQGNQITAIAAATDDDTLTLWLGTKVSGEGNPYLPADGLIAYRPNTQTLDTYQVMNSPLVSAIPYQIAVEEDELWVATGEGVCQVEWKTIERDQSWNCWRFAATAELPTAGVDLYPSFLSAEPVTTLTQPSVEVLWASESFEPSGELLARRYEVAYEPGFEVQIPQGGYRLTNPVVRKTTKGNNVFWPGHAWHWQGDRFARSLDEVAVNMVGGGPHGLVAADRPSDRTGGLSFDNHAVRGDFDLLEITSDSTQVHHYSGWVESADLAVYPTVVSVESPTEYAPNPLTEMATNLPDSPGP